MALNDLFDVIRCIDEIPRAFGIDDDRRPHRAIVEAAGRIGPDFSIQTGFFDFFLEQEPQRLGALGPATAARVFGIALIGADEDMAVESLRITVETHVFMITKRGGGVNWAYYEDLLQRPIRHCTRGNAT